ncbi:SPFH/Band 7/PHB domain protein, partial [bacterium]|nr:SPFH/Band 7/PHB domain protein [bacterium]
MWLTVLLILVVLYIVKGVIIVQQMEEVIIERLGSYQKTLKPGLNFIIPIIDTPRGINWKISQKGIDGQTYSYTKTMTKIDKRETVYDFPRQNVITKDNVTISINAL